MNRVWWRLDKLRRVTSTSSDTHSIKKLKSNSQDSRREAINGDGIGLNGRDIYVEKVKIHGLPNKQQHLQRFPLLFFFVNNLKLNVALTCASSVCDNIMWSLYKSHLLENKCDHYVA